MNDFDRMYHLEIELGVEIVSYGLAPNPWGYVYEIMDEVLWEAGSEADKKELNLLCDVCDEGYLL